MLEARDGLLLDRGCLTGNVPAITSSIRQLCADCAATTRGEGTSPGGPLALPRPSGRRELQLLVCPVKRAEPLGVRDDRIAAVVFVSDPDQVGLPDQALLQTFYGLTPAEANVAARLAAGDSVEDIAAEHRYTKQTVQWYSKQVLVKTGCRSRAALARQLSITLASLASRRIPASK
jgi:DNA-binding CsgD family transcriptional regulator